MIHAVFEIAESIEFGLLHEMTLIILLVKDIVDGRLVDDFI